MDGFLKRSSNKVKGKERKSQKVVVRKNDCEYIKYGFIKAGNDFEPKVQCFESRSQTEKGRTKWVVNRKRLGSAALLYTLFRKQGITNKGVGHVHHALQKAP